MGNINKRRYIGLYQIKPLLHRNGIQIKQNEEIICTMGQNIYQTLPLYRGLLFNIVRVSGNSIVGKQTEIDF